MKNRIRKSIDKAGRTVKRKVFWMICLAFFSISAVSYKLSENYFEISKNLEIFATLYRELNLYYVDKTEPGELMKTGIDAMLQSLDPYTNYIPESDIEEYRYMTTGQYGGIGAVIRSRDDYVIISEPYEGFPAETTGLWAGDKIISVNGKDIKGKTVSEVSELLKGQAGTSVTVTVERMGSDKPLEFEITREKVQVPSVPYHGMLNDTIGYIKLRSFTQTASQDVKNAFKDLKEHGMEQLLFDLRGNSGGLLKEAVDIVNFFVPKGQEVVSTQGRIQEWDKSYRCINEPLDTNIRLGVLVDGNSASASEIVSGAIQDLDRGVIIGKRTYGKGLVQQTRNLSYNSKLKLTVAKYYIPSGRCIQEVDYSSRDKKGHAKDVPDSLIKSYTTRNGRKVLDARGIHPDIKVDKKQVSRLTQKLLAESVIFDHATRFHLDHDSIAPPEEFKISEEVYKAFKQKVLEMDLDYKTQSEEVLEKLEKTAKKEDYFDEAEKEFTKLKEELDPDKKRDLNKFSDEIREFMRNEIVARYYFQTGQLRANLQDDRFVDSAFAALEPSRYHEILTVSKDK